MAYSAGTAWLQVTPSFRHINRELNQDVRRLAQQIDEGIARAVPEAMRRGAEEGGRDLERTATRSGEQGGRRYGDAFSEALHRRIGGALRGLPPAEIGVARTAFDQDMKDIRGELEHIRDQHINLEIDDTEAIRRIHAVREQMLALERRTRDRAAVVNLRVAGADLDVFERIVREARRSGLEAGGNFGGAFGESVERHFGRILTHLPDIPLRADLTIFDHAMRQIRREIAGIRDFRIGIDGDATEFTRRVREVEERIARLRRANVSVQFNMALDRSTEQLRRFMNETVPNAVNQGAENAGGRFTTTLTRQINKALQSLPEIRLTADSTPIQQEIARIRGQMASIRDLHIRGELDATQVKAQLTVLQARLREIARRDVDIQIRADAAGALAALTAVSTMMRSLDGEVANIGRSAGGSIGRLGAIIAAGLSIGTVIVPAAAGAAVAIGGIATAAAAAAAGLGVLILGFSGVVSGVTALHKYTQDVDKSAKSLSQSQNQILSATDSLQSAEEALGNARRQNATQAEQAQRRIKEAIQSESDARREASRAVQQAVRQQVDAEKDLTRAQVDAREAREALTEAYAAAVRRLAELRRSVRDNALDQRQAVLDLAEAKEELAKITANPRATQAEIEQARITYERRLNQINDLKDKSKELHDQQRKADKDGLEGAEEVKQARERIANADERVADAQQRVADAQQRVIEAMSDGQRRVAAAEQATADARRAAAEQAIQGQQQIAAASRALEQAQRGVAQAYVNAGVAGGEALDNLKDAMASLSPEAQRFVRYLYSMKDAALGLRQAAERGMLPGFQQALREIQPYLPGLERFVFKVAEGLGWIAVAVVRSLAHPAWRQFFGYIDDIAVPALKGMWQFSEAVARGLGSLIFALSPFNKSMGKGLIQMAESFATWADKLTTSSGYVKFLAYVRDNGPAVVDMLGEMADFMKRFILAAAPIGSVVVRIFDILFSIINAIPVPVLSGIVLAIGLLSFAILANAAATRAMALAQSLATNSAGLWTIAKGKAAAAAGVYTGAVERATLATGALSWQQAAMTGSAAVMRRAGSGIVSFLTGPWVTAILVATAVLGLLFASMSSADGKAKQLRDSWAQYGQALKDGVTAQSLESAQSILKQNTSLQGLLRTARDVGVAQKDLVDGLNGDAEARAKVIGKIDEEIARLEKLNEFSPTDTRSAEEIRATTERIKKLKELRDSFNAVSTAEEKASIAAQYLNAAQDNLKASVQELRTALGEGPHTAEQFKTALGVLGTISEQTQGKLAGLAAIAGKVSASNLDAGQKSELFNTILNQLGSSAQAKGPTFDALAGTFHAIASSALNARDKSDLLSKAMDQMYSAAIKQTEAAESLIRAEMELTSQLKTNEYGFDLTTEAGLKHRHEVLANRDALQAALQALREKYLQDIANGVAEEKARKAHEDSTKALLGQLPVTQQNSAAVQQLVQDYGSIPPVKKTDVSTPGLDDAIADLINAHVINQGLAASPPWSRDKINTEISILRGLIYGGFGTSPKAFKAHGGPIEGYSPHKRADNVGIWATAGEFMHQVDAVDYYGEPVMHAINNRVIPREVFDGYATGGLIGTRSTQDSKKWPVNVPSPIHVNLAEWWKKYDDSVAAYYASLGGSDIGDVGSGPGFTTWPSSPSAQRGDSGVWRSIVNLIRSTGPVSGSFGNAYRHGDPLWHGSGRAVDWMGYNQDALAGFLASKRPLELIHRTNSKDYAFTRGRNIGSFSRQLMEEHRNHIHIAMDQGGYLQPGWNPPIWNGTGRVEPVLNPGQWSDISRMVRMQAEANNQVPRQYQFTFADTTLTPGLLRAMQDRDDAIHRRGRAR